MLFASYWFHGFFHAEPAQFCIGMTTQVVTALACMAALFAFPRTDVDAQRHA